MAHKYGQNGQLIQQGGLPEKKAPKKKRSRLDEYPGQNYPEALTNRDRERGHQKGRGQSRDEFEQLNNNGPTDYSHGHSNYDSRDAM